MLEGKGKFPQAGPKFKNGGKPGGKDKDEADLPPGHGGADGDPNAKSQDGSTITVILDKIMTILDWCFGLR